MSTNNPQISIIVPIYNVENYLHRCIDSILIQSYTNFELLLINDGSTDKSGQICDEYAKQDERIQVFHKENRGVSSARQLGIDKATGEYSIHIDSDDWVDPTMLMLMYQRIILNGTDILITDLFVETQRKTIYKKQRPTKLQSRCVLKEILIGSLFGGLQNKLLKHNLLKKYNIQFIPNINYCEDVLFWCQLLQHNITISYLDKSFYHYNQTNLNSITHNYTEETYAMRKSYILSLEQILPRSFSEIIHQAVAYNIKREALYFKILTKGEYYTYMPTKLSTILRTKGSYKDIFFMILAYFGYFNLSYKLYHKLKDLRSK